LPEKGDLRLLCSFGGALAAIGHWFERHNEHLYTYCNENSDSTGRIVPTLVIGLPGLLTMTLIIDDLPYIIVSIP